MESALMIVPPQRRASASVSADLPLAVGPATISARKCSDVCSSSSGLPTGRRLAPTLAGSTGRHLVAAVAPWHGYAAMRHTLTLVAAEPPLDPAILARVRDAVGGGEPDALAPGEAADIALDGAPDMEAVREALAGAAIDAIAAPTQDRRKQLLIADMDSTIVTSETLDELADFAGLKEPIAAITRRAMNGEIDFAQALRERVAMLRDLPLDALERTWQRIELTPGARELVATMRANGALTVLVSGGFSYFTDRLAGRVGFDVHRANTLLDDGRALIGRVAEPILDRNAKLQTLRALAAERGLRMAQTLAVGDGANDLGMLREAGLGVAFHAKPVVASAVTARIDHASLRALLFAQGYRAGEIVSH
jgi:phosphoserine phosphatase